MKKKRSGTRRVPRRCSELSMDVILAKHDGAQLIHEFKIHVVRMILCYLWLIRDFATGSMTEAFPLLICSKSPPQCYRYFLILFHRGNTPFR
ncbi:hypothetical protein V3C99_009913 [Haemonchus contortus]